MKFVDVKTERSARIKALVDTAREFGFETVAPDANGVRMELDDFRRLLGVLTTGQIDG